MESDRDKPVITKAVLPIVGSTTAGALGGVAGVVIGGPFGGLVGGGLGALVPALIDIPASKRHRERLESSLRELQEQLSADIDTLRGLTDEQFKIINDCLLTLQETVEAEKIDYLKKIVVSATKYDDYHAYESMLLSRIIRDISAEEISFLVKNFGYKSVNIYSWHDENDESEENRDDLDNLKARITDEEGLLLLPDTPEALVANGLVSLGVLVPEKLSLGVHRYKYSDISVKLIVLLK